ncbi:Ribonuclease P protein subunit [Trichinella spiralis]|uniref:Ribonuclease P protein subunit n=1 Tax=Trichinella spiralis TaxID=6334 RepID=A0ABR3KSX3_TRISP
MPPKRFLKLPITVQWPETDDENATKILRRLSTRLQLIRKKRSKSESAQPEAGQCSAERKNFSIGLNEVIRDLEKRRLQVALFDHDVVKPSGIAFQIGALAASTGVHTARLNSLNAELSAVLNYHSVSAVGIRQGEDELVALLKQHTSHVLLQKNEHVDTFIPKGTVKSNRLKRQSKT